GADLKVRENDFDLLILDAETRRMGGIGLGKRVRDEIDEDMPYIVLIARPQDEWLARVSKPNAILQYPVDGRELSAAVKDILAAK
ncbi:MAG: two-component system response regulator, partial [Arcanobacterium sp.]|nr:two-component system response regulator [Arcanobacterium sp.]